MKLAKKKDIYRNKPLSVFLIISILLNSFSLTILIFSLSSLLNSSYENIIPGISISGTILFVIILLPILLNFLFVFALAKMDSAIEKLYNRE